MDGTRQHEDLASCQPESRYYRVDPHHKFHVGRRLFVTGQARNFWSGIHLANEMFDFSKRTFPRFFHLGRIYQLLSSQQPRSRYDSRGKDRVRLRGANNEHCNESTVRLFSRPVLIVASSVTRLFWLRNKDGRAGNCGEWRRLETQIPSTINISTETFSSFYLSGLNFVFLYFFSPRDRSPLLHRSYPISLWN